MIALAGAAGLCILGMLSIFTSLVIHEIWFSGWKEMSGWVLIGSFVFWIVTFFTCMWWSDRKRGLT